MGVRIVIPDSVFGGFYHKGKLGKTFYAIGLMAHSLQCDQVWIFLIRVGKRRFGYRTVGDASQDTMTYKDHGWHFPWQKRFISGRG